MSVNYPPTAEPMGWASWVKAPSTFTDIKMLLS